MTHVSEIRKLGIKEGMHCYQSGLPRAAFENKHLVLAIELIQAIEKEIDLDVELLQEFLRGFYAGYDTANIADEINNQ